MVAKTPRALCHVNSRQSVRLRLRTKVPGGQPGRPEELINAGKDADMIVLGSRGAGGFTRLMMGSVAGQVAQHALCPVLIVPPENRG